MTVGQKALTPAGQPIVSRDGVPTVQFGQWLDFVKRFIFDPTSIFVGTTAPQNLQNFANDAAAAAGGIAIGQLYRNGSVVQVRVM